LGRLILSSTSRFANEFPSSEPTTQPRRIAARAGGLRTLLDPGEQGSEETQKHNQEGYFSLCWGHFHVGGDWRFFPVALAVYVFFWWAAGWAIVHASRWLTMALSVWRRAIWAGARSWLRSCE